MRFVYIVSILTVDHLQDAPLAGDVWQLVPHVHDLALLRTIRLRLIHLIFAALRVDIIATGESGVDWTVGGVIGRTGERVFVEAGLSHNSVRVLHVGCVAEKEFQVALERGVGHGQGKGPGKRATAERWGVRDRFV